MVLKVAKRGAIPPFIVMDVMRAANEREAGGEGVLHLEVGQPGTSAPKAVLEAARAALFDDRIGYTEATGLPALRRRIAAHYRDVYGVTVEPERVIVTTGSSGGFVLSFLAVFEAGAGSLSPARAIPPIATFWERSASRSSIFRPVRKPTSSRRRNCWIGRPGSQRGPSTA